MVPDWLCELELCLCEVIIDVKVVCQAERNLARIVFHPTKEVISQHSNCVNIDFKTIASSLIKDFWCVELKTFKLLV